MGSNTKYPLLIQGFDVPSVAAGASGGASGTFAKERGNVNWIDVVPVLSTTLTGAEFNLRAGSVGVIENSQFLNWTVDGSVWRHKYVPVDIDPGQTWNLQINNSKGGGAADCILHAHYENKYDTREWMCKMEGDELTLKQLDFYMSAAIGQVTEFEFLIPKDQGQVVAFQILSQTAIRSIDLANRINMDVNGTAVLINCCAGIFGLQSNRKMLTLPCPMEQSAAVKVEIRNTSAAIEIYSLRVFFDNGYKTR